MWAYGLGTQANLLGPVLRLLELLAAGPPIGPPLPLPRTPKALFPLAILYA